MSEKMQDQRLVELLFFETELTPHMSTRKFLSKHSSTRAAASGNFSDTDALAIISLFKEH
jgi:hypothetical protein